MRAEGRLTAAGAGQVLDRMLAEGGEAEELAARLGLSVLGEAGLRAEIQAVLDAHPDELRRLRQGEDKLRGFLLGQVMRATRGRAEPQAAQRLLIELLQG